MENIKNWKKQNYHKQMLGGLKEAKELDKDFEKAQKPWAKLQKKVNEAKKNYYRLESERVYYVVITTSLVHVAMNA